MSTTLTSITDADLVRTRGGLAKFGDAGGPTVEQIEAAILSAQEDVRYRVSKAVYDTVRDFSPTDLETPANQEKYDAFELAEAYLALKHLPIILLNAQLGASGHVQVITVGQGTQTFASVEEAENIGKSWEARAYRLLAPYVASTLTETEDDGTTEPTMVVSADRRFTFMGI